MKTSGIVTVVEILCIVISGVGVFMHTKSLWLSAATSAALYVLLPWRPRY